MSAIPAPENDKNRNDSYDPRKVAQNAIDKARKESLEAKVKDKMKLKTEHSVAIKQLDREIEQLVEDYEQGL